MKKTIKSVLICLLTFVNMAVIAQDEIPNLKKPSSWNQYLGFYNRIWRFGNMENPWHYKRFVGGNSSWHSLYRQFDERYKSR